MSDSLLVGFCHGDDFCQLFLPRWQQQLVTPGVLQRNRPRPPCLSAIMTLVSAFHTSHYRDLTAFSLFEVQGHWRTEFPGVGSYSRFVDFLPSAFAPLCASLRHCFGPCTGIPFVDATPLRVRHNRRIAQHRVFTGLAARGKTSLGWLFGFKLPLLVNDTGALLKVALPPGTTTDRQPVPRLAQRLFGEALC